ncbi:hypothetical protein BpHYR1_010719 [Brachionus plicatilis]|uniref:Uncharacterized protein n=1 Tax=Brachionus plicatilis TaxID=10195 RepID=A0A3M7Q5M9_BRAPC|nr:hypothetical protein BpHYR1_010719 [Brachionus plicatilis]
MSCHNYGPTFFGPKICYGSKIIILLMIKTKKFSQSLSALLVTILEPLSPLLFDLIDNFTPANCSRSSLSTRLKSYLL